MMQILFFLSRCKKRNSTYCNYD